MLIEFIGLHLIYLYQLTSELSLLNHGELFVQAYLPYNANIWVAYPVRRSTACPKRSVTPPLVLSAIEII